MIIGTRRVTSDSPAKAQRRKMHQYRIIFIYISSEKQARSRDFTRGNIVALTTLLLQFPSLQMNGVQTSTSDHLEKR